MRDESKTREQLISELAEMRQIAARLEVAKAERKRAEDMLRQRDRELSLLDQASRAFNSTLHLDQVLTTVLEKVRRLLDVIACSIWLVDSETDELVCRQATGPKSKTVRNWRLMPGEGIVGWVTRSGESLIVPDVQADERHFKDVDPGDELALRSILSIPLAVKQDVIGVLQIVDAQIGRFDASDLALLEPLAASAAIAIENARLYERAQQEIVERKQAEEERARLLAQVQEQAQQMQQVMDTVPDGVFLVDAGLRLLLANPPARECLSILSGVKVGDTLTRLGERPLKELLTSPPKGLWHEVKVDDSPQRVFEMVARPMEQGSETKNWVLVIRDVTQKREVQQRIQRQERLATVGQMAAGIAHDFNNIMATIVLSTQVSSQTSGLSAQDRGRLAIVNQQAMHASNLIRQILDFSRDTVLDRQPLDLGVFLTAQVDLLEHTLPENIKIDLICEPGACMIDADPTRIQQVMMNLAFNARDAMPEGGELCIELERVQIESSNRTLLPKMEIGEWVRIQVSDIGMGIPPDVLPHIFDPFFTTKSDDKGTGLGLAQVWGIVNQHDGHIDVKSRLEEGTTFTIYLPVLQDSQPETLALEETPTLPRGRREIVLVVEDNMDVRQAVTEGLESLNYQTLAAANGCEALDLFWHHADEIALVLSDMVMPEMGGMALSYALREKGYAGQIVILTGHPMHVSGDDLSSQGITTWLQKPVSLEKLAQVVTQALT